MRIRDFQEVVHDWVRHTFGEEIASNSQERALRVVEEACELAQAVGVRDEDQIHDLVASVFGRPAGQVAQELAGTLVTLSACAAAHQVDLEEAGVSELTRIHRPEIVAKCQHHQEEKRAAGLTGEATERPARRFYWRVSLTNPGEGSDAEAAMYRRKTVEQWCFNAGGAHLAFDPPGCLTVMVGGRVVTSHHDFRGLCQDLERRDPKDPWGPLLPEAPCSR
jgi:NTP pyrophosphatase (non-canonical NTP hydrolase)